MKRARFKAFVVTNVLSITYVYSVYSIMFRALEDGFKETRIYKEKREKRIDKTEARRCKK